MKFPVKVPCTFPRLYFNAIDFSTFSGDETIGESYISFKRVFKKLMQEGTLTIENKWIPFTHPKDPGEPKGEVKLSIFLVNKFEAEQDPVGESWDEPNKNPYLERPLVGRGIGDFLKGFSIDMSWLNFDLFGCFKLMSIAAMAFVIFVILFVQPGILV